MSSGLGGLNKSKDGVVIGLVQLQLPVVKTRSDLAQQTSRIVELVGKARRNLSTMDLVIFPEYMLQGLSMDTSNEVLCDRTGPEMQACSAACKEHNIWGCFSIMERNMEAPNHPYNVGIIFDNDGREVL
jgi:formamidase